MIARSKPTPLQPSLAPAGVRLYAVGDIHGRADLLDEMLEMILDDSHRSRMERRVVVFLGDYVDRGPDSRAVVERLATGLPDWPGFHWICLKGNHEDLMLRFLADVEVGPTWMSNGAMATIESYVGPGPALTVLARNPEMMAELREKLIVALPATHRDFLSTLRTIHVEGDYCFVHAGVRPGIPLDHQVEDDLLWIRRSFLASSEDFGKRVVHGHSITTLPDVRANRIGIDTGAFFSDRLTTLVAEGESRGFLST